MRLLLLRAGSVISSTALGLLLGVWFADDSPAWWPQLFEDYVGVPWLVGLVAVSIITWNGVVDGAPSGFREFLMGFPIPFLAGLLSSPPVWIEPALRDHSPEVFGALAFLACAAVVSAVLADDTDAAIPSAIATFGELRFGSALVSALGAAAQIGLLLVALCVPGSVWAVNTYSPGVSSDWQSRGAYAFALLLEISALSVAVIFIVSLFYSLARPGMSSLKGGGFTTLVSWSVVSSVLFMVNLTVQRNVIPLYIWRFGTSDRDSGPLPQAWLWLQLTPLIAFSLRTFYRAVWPRPR